MKSHFLSIRESTPVAVVEHFCSKENIYSGYITRIYYFSYILHIREGRCDTCALATSRALDNSNLSSPITPVH